VIAPNVISTILDWLLDRAGVVIFVLIIVVQMVRGLLKTRQEAPPPEGAKPDALEEQRRVQEIQQAIRRRIAERRGEAPAAEPPPLVRRAAAPTPTPVPETTQMPDPFGGSLRRVLQELERHAQPELPPPPPPVPPVVENRNLELERQRKLADEMKALEESRLLMKRRATKAAAIEAAEAGSETGLRTAARGRALDGLLEPESLRRAIVLREVLGTPVGLR
jgi:hypothetical protein